VPALENTHRRSTRQRGTASQRGTAMVVTLIALTGLGTLGTITMLSVEGGLSAATADRSHAIALLAAESGAAAGLDFLRRLSYSQYNWFSNNIRASNIGAETPPAIRGNERMPGQSGNVFSADMKAWYRVTIYNNETDPNFANSSTSDSIDSDGFVVLESIGYGPNRAVATIRVEVQGIDGGGTPEPTQTPPRTLAAPPQFLDGLSIVSWREVE
jgi:Tfp pilus assembly protein PilX